MKNGSNPAYPFEYDGEIGRAVESGLTKREYFAGLAMQAITTAAFSSQENNEKLSAQYRTKYTNGETIGSCISKEAIAMADSLLKELEATK